MGGGETVVGQQLLQITAHRLVPAGARIGLEGVAAIVAELLE